MKPVEIPAHYRRVMPYARVVEDWTRGKYTYDLIKDGEDYIIRRHRILVGLDFIFSREADKEEDAIEIRIKGDHENPELAYLQIKKHEAVEKAFNTLKDSLETGKRTAVIGFFIATVFIPGPEDIVLTALAIRHGVQATRVKGVLEFTKDGRNLTSKEVDETIKLAQEIGKKHTAPRKELPVVNDGLHFLRNGGCFVPGTPVWLRDCPISRRGPRMVHENHFLSKRPLGRPVGAGRAAFATSPPGRPASQD